jgi:hypothetical protein
MKRPPAASQQPLNVPARRVAVRRAGAAAAVFLLAQAVFAMGPPEVVIRPARDQVPPVTAQEKKRAQEAIDRGVAYLRRTQLPTGSWIIGSTVGLKGGRYTPLAFPAGFAGLGGLALLESAVRADDPAVQAAARFIRQSGPQLFRTYDLAVAVLFLDRLGSKRDRPLIRSLGLRLAAGQTAWGGWSYNCPVLTAAREKKLAEALSKKARADLPRWLRAPSPPPSGMQGRSSDVADNSNTQFAILALCVAQRYDLPVNYPLALVAQRFRFSENTTGWDYQWVQGRPRSSGSMTCAGLLGLAVGGAAREEKEAPEGNNGRERPENPGIVWGLRILGTYLRDPSDSRANLPRESQRALNLYFLWSVERVGVLCSVDTIGGIDWYRWGAGLLMPTQRADGSWLGRGSCGYPAADTSFALLFLKRSDLLPDLRKQLAKRVKIVDPGPFVQGGPATKGPDLKGLIAADQGPLTADLGAVPAGKASPIPLRVRGPADFRITAIRGDDKQLKVQLDSQSTKVHDLTVTLHLDKAGPFERTLYLQTDLPSRAEVAVRVRATATPAAGQK